MTEPTPKFEPVASPLEPRPGRTPPEKVSNYSPCRDTAGLVQRR